MHCLLSKKKKKTEAGWLSLSRIHLKSVLRVPYAWELTVFKNISKRLLTLFRFLFLLSNFHSSFHNFISANLFSISRNSMSMRLCLKRQLKQLKNFSLKNICCDTFSFLAYFENCSVAKMATFQRFFPSYMQILTLFPQAKPLCLCTFLK